MIKNEATILENAPNLVLHERVQFCLFDDVEAYFRKTLWFIVRRQYGKCSGAISRIHYYSNHD